MNNNETTFLLCGLLAGFWFGGLVVYYIKIREDIKTMCKKKINDEDESLFVERVHFKVVYKCEECLQPITYHEMMDSHGVCPRCGKVSQGTVVRCIKESMKVK